MLISVGLGRTDGRRASRAALGADYRCPLVSLVALITWRVLLFGAKQLLVAAIGPCMPMGRATGPLPRSS
jgi:hypothetical protein